MLFHDFVASVFPLICRSQLLAVNSLQAKVTQPKDDDWSDCAKNGYAGIVAFLR